MSKEGQPKNLGTGSVVLVIGTILLAVGLTVFAGSSVMFSSRLFYDMNFETFQSTEPLTKADKTALVATHKAHQQALFHLMLTANLGLLGACAYLFWKLRR